MPVMLSTPQLILLWILVAIIYVQKLIQKLIMQFIKFITNYLPVKVIRDDKGRPFLYRYHLFMLTNNGPGICIHNFVKSDPDRGYHDHPWKYGLSFILSGGYTERIYNKDSDIGYDTYEHKTWDFNLIRGEDSYHRVMLDEGKDAWSIFFFTKRCKTWNMITLNGNIKQMSTTINDLDGGWWNHVIKGFGLHHRLNNIGNVVATVDIVVVIQNKVLLIKRGKNPYKDHWAIVGGRIDQTDENILAAAYRELYEETNLTDKDLKLEYRKTIGNNTRDSRGFSITNVFIGYTEDAEFPTNVKAGDDAIDFKWIDIRELPVLAFDHNEIIEDLFV